MKAWDIPRNNIAAILAVKVFQRENPGSDLGYWPDLLLLQDDEAQIQRMMAALKTLRTTGKVPEEYREQVENYLHAHA